MKNSISLALLCLFVSSLLLLGFQKANAFVPSRLRNSGASLEKPQVKQLKNV